MSRAGLATRSLYPHIRQGAEGNGTRAREPAMVEDAYLEGRCLIAMPTIGDSRFDRSLIYLCAHSSDGAMGLVVNKPLDDLSFEDMLVQLGITDGERAELIRGSGVDIDHFRPPTDHAGRFHPTLQLLFPSRLIREKGVDDVLDACRTLWDEGIPLELLVAGDLDGGNRSSLSAAELQALAQEPRLRCLGHVDDMAALYAASDVVVLPSWREGLSRALIEAAAMERPIITTDVPGCRDVVDHGRSGLLVPLHDSRAIQLALQLLLEHPDLARRFGKAARRKVEAEFQVSLVNEHTLTQYQRLLPVG